MKPQRKLHRAGKSAARATAPVAPDTKRKGESKSARSGAQPRCGDAKDSRTRVIEESRAPRIGIPFHATSPAKRAALIRLRDTHPGSSVRVQQDRLEMALRRWPLTFQEMWELGLQDGRARIYGLKQRGLAITKVWVIIETDFGQRHRVGLYSLRPGSAAPALIPCQPDLFREMASTRNGCTMADEDEVVA